MDGATQEIEGPPLSAAQVRKAAQEEADRTGFPMYVCRSHRPGRAGVFWTDADSLTTGKTEFGWQVIDTVHPKRSE